ncbi:hypothetical protein [Streptomyces sp. NPDC005438]|uniref:hypothetical protein n=1 Tax=Streptomyces sp. NPDC005438 TaxID=3156880 RepID=UPI0033A64B2A
MTADAEVWRPLAALLPPAPAREVMDCWSVGEQESAIALLVSALLAHDLTISGYDRAQLSVLAEMWGQREATEEQLLRCRALPHDDSPLRLLAPTEPLAPGNGFPGHPADSPDLLVVPWITCARCGQTLGRVHRREPWGDLSFSAVHYPLWSPGATAPSRVFATGAEQEAFDALASCPCGKPPGA